MSNSSNTHVKTIKSLTGIRILAASWVVLAHMSQPLLTLFSPPTAVRDFVESGYLGVEVFFTLSGFIIAHNYAARFSSFCWQEYKNFLILRFARIYPLHLVTLILAGAFGVFGFAAGGLGSGVLRSVGTFLMNAGMMQFASPANSWNLPSWSVSCEVGAYAMFPLLATVIWRLRSRGSLLAAIAVALSLTVGGTFTLSSGGPFSPISAPEAILRIAGEFSAGCFLWGYWNMHGRRSISGNTMAILGLLGVLMVVLIIPGQGPLDFLVLPFICMSILGCAQATGTVDRMLSSRLMQYGGLISYSLYMWHWLGFVLLSRLLPWQTYSQATVAVRLAVVCTYFGTALFGAVIFFHVVEEPGRNVVRRAASRGRAEESDMSESSSSRGREPASRPIGTTGLA